LEAAGELYNLWYYGARKYHFVMMNLLRIFFPIATQNILASSVVPRGVNLF
jgi:hypothetical protein